MADERYRVVFKGQLADKATLDDVTANLTALYKNNSAKADAILSSGFAVIKKDLDLATCQKIQNAFQKAGAICSIEKQAAASDLKLLLPKMIALLPGQRMGLRLQRQPSIAAARSVKRALLAQNGQRKKHSAKKIPLHPRKDIFQSVFQESRPNRVKRSVQK